MHMRLLQRKLQFTKQHFGQLLRRGVPKSTIANHFLSENSICLQTHVHVPSRQKKVDTHRLLMAVARMGAGEILFQLRDCAEEKEAHHAYGQTADSTVLEVEVP